MGVLVQMKTLLEQLEELPTYKDDEIWIIKDQVIHLVTQALGKAGRHKGSAVQMQPHVGCRQATDGKTAVMQSASPEKDSVKA